jgi:glyoxalase family protein
MEAVILCGVQGAGSVHHVAWASTMEDHEAWRTAVERAGARPTPVIDRFYFRSIYFREPSGVLFEIATLGPGFTTDEPLEHLGERLSLPPDFEHLRDRVEPLLTPLPNPRATQATQAPH